MGSNTFGASGVNLPPPQALFPVTIGGIPQLVGTNQLALGPGEDFLIPSGTWAIQSGQYSQIQIFDPVTQTWRLFANASATEVTLNSDGVNYRIINPTGFPIGAMVNNAGTGYTSAPAVAVSLGGSTWLALVGGGVSALNITNPSSGSGFTNVAGGSGAGYAVPPLINIAAPPSPGVQATAICAISGGAISSFTITNPGAGYTAAPPVQIVPQQSDLNVAAGLRITNAGATAQLSYVGQVTAVLLTNEGNNPLTAVPALTFSGGGGSGATATAAMAFALTAVTVTTPGSGYTAGTTAIMTTGGVITSGAATSNSALVSTGILMPPRQAQVLATAGSGTGIGAGVILDGGLFAAPPNVIALGGIPTTLAALSAQVGGVNDVVFVTPL